MNALRKIAGKPKYYIIFPAVVLALFSTSIIQTTCPVCTGTGSLSQSVGMENIRIVSIESRIIGSTQDACTGYIVTRAKPVITLTNTGTQQASGYLTLKLFDHKADLLLVSQHLAVEAEPNALSVLESQIGFYYYTGDRPPDDMEIQAEIALTDIPCLACTGKGRVSANAFLLAISARDTFISNIRSQSQYTLEDSVIIGGQCVLVGSEEWLDWMELN